MLEEKDYFRDRNAFIPYECSKGHLIDNQTYNDFNNRLWQNLNPCQICRETTYYDTQKSLIETKLHEKNMKLIELNPKCTKVVYQCRCGLLKKCDRSQVLHSKTFMGCLSCNNPFGRDEIKEKIKQTNLEKYGVENVMHNKNIYLKTTHHNSKEYTLPSGKKIFTRGFEDKCIPLLLEEYKEYDIVFECDDIEAMPQISYTCPYDHTTIRIYYPDMFIPKDNIVVEVKSTHLYKKEYLQLKTKIDQCIKDQYIVWLYILDGDFNVCKCVFRQNRIEIFSENLDFLKLQSEINSDQERDKNTSIFQCPDCEIVCRSQSKLKSHVKAVHQQLKDHLCGYCDFKTARKDSLKRHIQRTHSVME